jgi:hypothetical protein
MGSDSPRGNTLGARCVLAIRTSALGGVAVVVWPVTKAPPKSGSWSDALHRRLGSLLPTYRLHDTTGEGLGLMKHTAANVEPGEVALPDGREALVTARVEASTERLG